MTPGPVVAAADAMARACVVWDGTFTECEVCDARVKGRRLKHVPECPVPAYWAARKDQADD